MERGKKGAAIKQRLLTAVVGLPLLILFIARSGPGLFAGLLCVLGAIGLYEFYAMALPRERRGEMQLAMALGTLLMTVLLFCPSPEAGLGMLVAVILALTILYLFRYRTLEAVVAISP